MKRYHEEEAALVLYLPRSVVAKTRLILERGADEQHVERVGSEVVCQGLQALEGARIAGALAQLHRERTSK